MGETATNTANINMRQALKLRVEEGCQVPDACLSSVCPLHSRCRDTWGAHSCVCQPGNSPVLTHGLHLTLLIPISQMWDLHDLNIKYQSLQFCSDNYWG